MLGEESGDGYRDGVCSKTSNLGSELSQLRQLLRADVPEVEDMKQENNGSRSS